jgi:FkbM family methyltransferase
VSYSQRDEERYILEVVGDAPGRFLDIGAWHPTALSNSRALYERGWGGVIVEPSPEPFLNLLKEYGNEDRVSLICAAVGFERTLTRFWATADALTTSSFENVEKWKNVAGFYGTFYCPMITLADITNQFGGFDFVSIDTEGTSVDLFHALLKTGMRPRCICVEHDSREVECAQAAQAANYRQAYMSPENIVYELR